MFLVKISAETTKSAGAALGVFTVKELMPLRVALTRMDVPQPEEELTGRAKELRPKM